MPTIKKGFVFDTNFIIQYTNLTEVVARLDRRYSVYITQVSIEERIGQQCRELKRRFDKMVLLQEENKDICRFELLTTYEKQEEKLRNQILAAYKKTFKEKIVPFQNTKTSFDKVLHRANYKEPPFIEHGSDKGFKDALMWLSLLEYFKDHGEDEIVFVTNDNGFRNNVEYLCNEFYKETGKRIEIKGNNYYEELAITGKKKNIVATAQVEPSPNVSSLREEISSAIEDLRWNKDYGIFDEEILEKTFEVTIKWDIDNVKEMLSKLKDVLEEHIFDKSLSASVFMGTNSGVVDLKNIPIEKVENLLLLYTKMQATHTTYLHSFYVTVANIINQSYQKPNIEDEMPF